MKISKIIGSNIQKLRLEQLLSQEKLSERAGIHQTYLSGLENGKRNPSVKILERIARALKVEVSDLTKNGKVFP